MSICARYDLLLIAPTAFKGDFTLAARFRTGVIEASVQLLKELYVLVAMTQIVPVLKIDGASAIEWYERYIGSIDFDFY